MCVCVSGANWTLNKQVAHLLANKKKRATESTITQSCFLIAHDLFWDGDLSTHRSLGGCLTAAAHSSQRRRKKRNSLLYFGSHGISVGVQLEQPCHKMEKKESQTQNDFRGKIALLSPRERFVHVVKLTSTQVAAAAISAPVPLSIATSFLKDKRREFLHLDSKLPFCRYQQVHVDSRNSIHRYHHSFAFS